jgi:hypothetical protein
VISHLVIYGGIGFVIACVVAVRYGPWFKKTSAQVDQTVTNVTNNIKDVVSKDDKQSSNNG